jgi:hypothetical protein
MQSVMKVGRYWGLYKDVVKAAEVKKPASCRDLLFVKNAGCLHAALSDLAITWSFHENTNNYHHCHFLRKEFSRTRKF